MKTLKGIFILGMTLAGVASANATMDREHYYVAGSGAMDWIFANTVTHSFTSASSDAAGTSNNVTVTNPLDTKNTFGGNLAVGYALDNWRFELEGSYRNSKQRKMPVVLSTTNIDSVNVDNTQNIATSSVSGIEMANVNNWALMANAFYDIPLTEDFTWYVGLGAGVAFDTKEVKSTATNTTTQQFPAAPLTATTTDLKEKDTLFAYQALTGVSYAITKDIEATLGYRLKGTSKPGEFEHKYTSANTTNTYKMNMQKWPHSHTIEAGLRFKL